MTETNKIYRMDCLEGLKWLLNSCVDLDYDRSALSD